MNYVYTRQANNAIQGCWKCAVVGHLWKMISSRELRQLRSAVRSESRSKFPCHCLYVAIQWILCSAPTLTYLCRNLSFVWYHQLIVDHSSFIIMSNVFVINCNLVTSDVFGDDGEMLSIALTRNIKYFQQSAEYFQMSNISTTFKCVVAIEERKF